MKTHRYFGSSESLDSRLDIATKMSRCIRAEVERVGLPLDVLTAAVERDLSRQPAKAAFNAMAMQGVDIMSTLLVDLGAGMGAVATEAAIRGAWPIAVEPGPGLRDIAAERLREVGRGAVLAASGESLPLRDSSVDIVVSLQVLEHVADPKAMLREVFRVLRPGGFFYLTCENYLSWREPHYRVFWVPLLPKTLGAIYLRLRGRSPEFLYSSVTYTTRPGVFRMLRECGFTFVRKERIDAMVREPGKINNRFRRWVISAGRRFVSARILSRVSYVAQEASMLCAGCIFELLRKPIETDPNPTNEYSGKVKNERSVVS